MHYNKLSGGETIVLRSRHCWNDSIVVKRKVSFHLLRRRSLFMEWLQREWQENSLWNGCSVSGKTKGVIQRSTNGSPHSMQNSIRRRESRKREWNGWDLSTTAVTTM